MNQALHSSERRKAPIVLALLAALAAGAAGYGLARWQAPHDAAAAPAPAAAASQARTVLYWYDPMKPDARFDKPGKSPFMDMDLVPRYADEATGSAVRIDPRLAQSLGMRVAEVKLETLGVGVQAPGTLGLDERAVALVQTRSAGFVERVFAHAPGDVIAAGAPLADLLVPEWAGAQQEYLALRKHADAALAQAARQRLLLLGMPESVVAQVEATGQPQRLHTVSSPIAGVVQELMVRSGMSLMPGMTLARINGLDQLWLDVAVPEAQAALVAPGRSASVTLPAFPGETFSGRVAAVLPEATRETRTLRVRIELPNKGGRLRAGLSAQVALAGPAQQALVVPSEAVIRTGRRNLVFVASDEPGRYEPQAVELGREVDGKLIVLQGLKAGQRVVVSGQFLIDSEASLAGVQPAPSASLYEVNAVVESVEAAEITVQHEPIPALKWPAMSMPFALKSPALAAGLKPGQKVRIAFSQGGSGPLIERIDRAPAPATPASAPKARP